MELAGKVNTVVVVTVKLRSRVCELGDVAVQWGSATQ